MNHCDITRSRDVTLTFEPSRCIKASFYILENRLNFPTTFSFRMQIFMKLVHQYMYIAIFVNFSPTSNHHHPLQVENCDSNSRLVVDEDDHGKFRLERINKCTLSFTLMTQETHDVDLTLGQRRRRWLNIKSTSFITGETQRAVTWSHRVL